MSDAIFPHQDHRNGDIYQDVQPWDWVPDPDALRTLRSKGFSKAARDQYMMKRGANWHIYRMTLAENRQRPASSKNKPVLLLGITVDADAKYTPATALSHMDGAKPNRWPTYLGSSLSGRLHCVWQFEAPIPVESKTHGDALTAAIIKDRNLDKIFAGGDEASADCVQPWTNGGVWLPTGAPPLDADYLAGIAYDWQKKHNAKGSISIPYAAVNDMLAKEYPAFKAPPWNKSFELGKCGPRFWDPTADNPRGAMAVRDGFYCLTGPRRGLIPFTDLVDADEFKEARAAAMGKIVQDFWNDSKGHVHWVDRENRGVVTLRTKDETLSRMNRLGVSVLSDGKGAMSDAEILYDYIKACPDKQIKGRAPMPFRRMGDMLDYGLGNKILCSHDTMPAPMSAEEKPVPTRDFPLIWSVMQHIWKVPKDNSANLDIHPKHYFLTMLKRAYREACTQRVTNYPVTFLIGDVGSGKNFVTECLVPSLFGSERPANPLSYLLGKSQFTDAIVRNFVWALNDELVDLATDSTRQRYKQTIKGVVKNNTIDLEPKHEAKVTVDCSAMLLVSANEAPQDIAIIPPMDDGVEDVCQFFRCQNSGEIPWEDNKNDNVTRVKAEISFFARWLNDVYVPPIEVIAPPDRVRYDDRIKQRCYADPWVTAISLQQQPCYGMLELLYEWVSMPSWLKTADAKGGREFTPTALCDELRSFFSDSMREWKVQRVAHALTDLARLAGTGVDHTEHSRFFRFDGEQIKSNFKRTV